MRIQYSRSGKRKRGNDQDAQGLQAAVSFWQHMILIKIRLDRPRSSILCENAQALQGCQTLFWYHRAWTLLRADGTEVDKRRACLSSFRVHLRMNDRRASEGIKVESLQDRADQSSAIVFVFVCLYACTRAWVSVSLVSVHTIHLRREVFPFLITYHMSAEVRCTCDNVDKPSEVHYCVVSISHLMHCYTVNLFGSK